jgi:hypothetical protein
MRAILKVAKIGAVLTLIVVAGVAFLLAALVMDRMRETVLPAPTGTFAVGRTTYVWSDALHTDSTAPQPGNDKRAGCLDLVSRSPSSTGSGIRRLHACSVATGNAGRLVHQAA